MSKLGNEEVSSSYEVGSTEEGGWVFQCREKYLPRFGDENIGKQVSTMKGLGSDVREFGSHAEGNGKSVKDLIQGHMCPVVFQYRVLQCF